MDSLIFNPDKIPNPNANFLEVYSARTVKDCINGYELDENYKFDSMNFSIFIDYELDRNW